jgi:hypothetical protein
VAARLDHARCCCQVYILKQDPLRRTVSCSAGIALFYGDPEGAQKVYILCIKSVARFCVVACRGLQLGDRLLLDLVQTYRRFQHKQHIEALFADVLHDFRNMLGLGNRLMDGFSQLLDKTTKSLIQRSTPNRHLMARFYLPYF